MMTTKIKVGFKFIYILNLIFLIKYSNFNIDELELNGIYNEYEYQRIVNHRIDENLKMIFNSFKIKVIDKIYTETDNSPQFNFLENKKLIFNKDKSWDVDVDENDILNNDYLTLEFYLNGEKVTLVIRDINEAIKFFEEDIFHDFIIPVDVNVSINDLKNIHDLKNNHDLNSNFEMNPDLNSNYPEIDKFEYEISPDYKSLRNCEKGYKKNISQLFCLLKGLFIISLRCDKYIQDGILKTREDPQTLYEKNKEIIKNLITFKYDPNNINCHNYIIRGSCTYPG
ncbi:hypothetical protein DMUE_0143 [Dictyocoela muelleri]|nr:hypothetical protein DMUE_0143 [Dictyocoela muelleri]